MSNPPDEPVRPVKPVGCRRSCTNYATRTLLDNWPQAMVWGRDEGPYKHAAPQRIPARFLVCVKNPAKWLVSYADYEARFLQMPSDQVLSQLYHRERVETLIEAYVTKHHAWLHDDLAPHTGAVLRHEDACQREHEAWRDVADALDLAWPPPAHGAYRPVRERVAPSNTGRKQPVAYQAPDYETHTYLARLSSTQRDAILAALERAGATGHGGVLDQLGYPPRLDALLDKAVDATGVGP
jgi:hypothetical protein